jgi:osmotically-inducible protein OsmY
MLFGLALLYFFMLNAKQVLIENDLQARVQQQLTAEGINSTTVVLERRGRDVLLSGSVSTEQERNRVIQLVEEVVGVRVVDNGIKLPSQEIPTLVLASNQQKIVLSGVFPSQEQIDDFVDVAKSVYGVKNVDNQLVIGENIASPVWLSDSKLLLPILHSVDKVTVTLSKDRPFLSGMVYSEAEKMAMKSAKKAE